MFGSLGVSKEDSSGGIYKPKRLESVLDKIQENTVNPVPQLATTIANVPQWANHSALRQSTAVLEKLRSSLTAEKAEMQIFLKKTLPLMLKWTHYKRVIKRMSFFFPLEFGQLTSYHKKVVSCHP